MDAWKEELKSNRCCFRRFFLFFFLSILSQEANVGRDVEEMKDC